jgi:hypothetical protein
MGPMPMDAGVRAIATTRGIKPRAAGRTSRTFGLVITVTLSFQPEFPFRQKTLDPEFASRYSGGKNPSCSTFRKMPAYEEDIIFPYRIS